MLKLFEKVEEYKKKYNPKRLEIKLTFPSGNTVKDITEAYIENQQTARINYLSPCELSVYDKTETGSIRGYYTVNIIESHGCCGKSYMYGFDGGSDHNVSSRDLLELLILTGETLSQKMGYTYIGFIHKAGHQSVAVGKELGFKTLLSFRNKRSSNDLEEMHKLI